MLRLSKQKPEVSVRSFGIYTKWDEASKELPKVLEFATRVRAEVDIEFGMVVNIRKAKNQTVRYCIYHPDIPDEHGKPRPPFDGEVYVRDNDWDFFLGDTIWEPIANKLGEWRMTIELGGRIVAEKVFVVY